MGYNITTIPNFDKQAKQLAKKHASIGSDLAQLANSLKESPTQVCIKFFCLSTTHCLSSGF